MDKLAIEAIKNFLQANQLAVVATGSSKPNSAPESALIAFVEDEKLCLYFQTGKHTRKAKNLTSNPHVSLVIGLGLEDLATLQYEGIAKLLTSPEEITACKQLFLDKNSPTTPAYLERRDAVIYKVTPNWINFSDHSKGDHPTVFQLTNF